MAQRAHILERLVLPAKYERLELRVGADLVKVLTPPEETLAIFRRIAAAVKKTYEGAFIPVIGAPGAGKTTLANSLGFFEPATFAPTLRYQGAITFDALTDTVARFRQAAGIVNGRILPVSIDHREGAPPTDEELAALKRFVRTTQAPMLVLWLETDPAIAQQIAARHMALTGAPVVPLPVIVSGPARETWQQIALHTLSLCNNLPEGEIVEIGIDPRTYDPAAAFPPAAATAILRRHGPSEVVELLKGAGRALPSPAELRKSLESTDLGRYLAGSERTASETRGRPAEDAQRQLAQIAAQYGYGGGRDKLLNRAVLEALLVYLPTLGVPVAASASEQGLPFCSTLIPDNQIDVGDKILCVEYCWRSGEGLASSRRSEVAQYALEKLRSYAVNLGWIAP